MASLYASATIVDESVTPNLGLSMPRRAGSGPTLLPSVTHGCISLLRSRRPARLFRRLDLELGRIAREGSVPDGLVRLSRFTAVVGDHSAVLVPSDFAHRSSAFERSLDAAGVAIAEPIGAAVDLDTKELVVLPGLADSMPVDHESDALIAPTGRYALRGLVSDDSRFEPGGRLAPIVMALVECLAERGGLADQDSLDGLADLVRETPVAQLGQDSASLGAVTELLGR